MNFSHYLITTPLPAMDIYRLMLESMKRSEQEDIITKHGHGSQEDVHRSKKVVPHGVDGWKFTPMRMNLVNCKNITNR